MSVSIIPVAVFVLQAALVIAAEILSPVKIPTIPAEFYIGLVFPETSSNPFNEDILVNVSLSSEFRYGYAGFTCGTVDKGPANDPSMKAFMIDFQSFSAITWCTLGSRPGNAKPAMQYTTLVHQNDSYSDLVPNSSGVVTPSGLSWSSFANTTRDNDPSSEQRGNFIFRCQNCSISEDTYTLSGLNESLPLTWFWSTEMPDFEEHKVMGEPIPAATLPFRNVFLGEILFNVTNARRSATEYEALLDRFGLL